MSITITSNNLSYRRSVVFLEIDEALDLLEGKLSELIRAELKEMADDAVSLKNKANKQEKDYADAKRRAKKLGVI